jgi:hypothetical protein
LLRHALHPFSEVEMNSSRLLVPVLFASFGVCAGTANAQTPPAPIVNGSDSCTTPDVLTGTGPFTYDTTTASTGVEGQTNMRCSIYLTMGIANDVWFTWTATSTGWVKLNFCGIPGNDTKVAVYTGSTCPTIEPVVCDDDGCGALNGASRAPFFATAGQAYTFQVGAYPTAAVPTFTGSFTIDPFTPGMGDDCAAPVVLTGAGPWIWDDLNTTTGTQGQMEALCSNEQITYDSWYTWTSPCNSAVTVSLCIAPGNDTKLAVYNGAGCPTAPAIACDDDFCGQGNTSQVTFNAVGGATYSIQIGMWPGWLPGLGAVVISTTCPPPAGTPYCFGDGSGTACPCGNNGGAGRGCASSVSPTGAILSVSGSASLAADTLVVTGADMPNSSCLYFQGTTQISAAFGDGLRCAGGSVIRLGTKTNSAGTSSYPGPGDQPVSVRGAITSPGTRNYQVWYRNAAAFCTPSTFNLSNGVSVLWS